LCEQLPSAFGPQLSCCVLDLLVLLSAGPAQFEASHSDLAIASPVAQERGPRVATECDARSLAQLSGKFATPLGGCACSLGALQLEVGRVQPPVLALAPGVVLSQLHGSVERVGEP
jgi:hypothetical protein